MSRYTFDDEPQVIIERESSGIGPFLMGAAIGAGLALLLAPRSGAATRNHLRRRVRRVRRSARRAMADVTHGVADSFDDARRRVEEQIDSAREAVEVKRRQMRRAVAAGRVAARDARRDLEQRLAETKAAYHAEAATDRSMRDAAGDAEIGNE